MDSDDFAQRLRQRPALDAAALRGLYAQAPSRELATAIWEIRRLHAALLDAFLRMERGAADRQASWNACYYGLIHLQSEPCIAAYLDEQWARRATPGARYYAVRAMGGRPDYHPPVPAEHGPGTLQERAAAQVAPAPPPASLPAPIPAVLPTGIAGKTLRSTNRYAGPVKPR